MTTNPHSYPEVWALARTVQVVLQSASSPQVKRVAVPEIVARKFGPAELASTRLVRERWSGEDFSDVTGRRSALGSERSLQLASLGSKLIRQLIQHVPFQPAI